MGFLLSDPKIYKKIQISENSYYDKLRKEDYITRFHALSQFGYVLDPSDGRWRKHGDKTMVSSTPWCHAKGTPQKNCNLDHHLIFNMWGIIPPRCQECWKVVVGPRSFKELMQLEQLENELNVPSKCGIELRDYTPRDYGGYFYNGSLDEGRECYKMVREAIDDVIGMDEDGNPVSVILKRACTEFEMLNGPSVFWDSTQEDLDFIELVEALVDVPRGNTLQDEMQKRHVRTRWFIWAHMNGDMTYTDWNNGEELWPHCVTYHEGDLDDIKRDLIMGRNYTHGVNSEIVTKFGAWAEQFKVENGLNFKQMNRFLRNDIGNFNIRADISEENMGEQDQMSTADNTENKGE